MKIIKTLPVIERDGAIASIFWHIQKESDLAVAEKIVDDRTEITDDCERIEAYRTLQMKCKKLRSFEHAKEDIDRLQKKIKSNRFGDCCPVRNPLLALVLQSEGIK